MKVLLLRTARWLAAGVVLALACVFLYMNLHLVNKPMIARVDERLPILFHSSAPIFWLWVFGLAATSVALAVWGVRNVRALKVPPAPPEEGLPEDRVAPLRAAWDEIVARLRPVPGPPVYLVLSPEKEQAVVLLAASGLHTDDTAPVEDDAPLSGFSTEEGLILWCGGRTAATVGLVCRALQGSTLGDPMVRGIVILVPAATLDGPQAQAQAVAARAGLRAAAKGLSTRCPVYLIVTGMESVPGFLEFAHRMPPDQRARGRFGISLPENAAPSYARIAGEFAPFHRWYDVSMINLIADDPLAQAGNSDLYGLGRWFRRSERSLLAVVETLSDIGDGDDPVDLLGCYFAATGPGPDSRAYAAGVVRGRVVGDPNSARWSRRALDADHRHRRLALILGAVGTSAALAAWVCILWGLGSLGLVGWALFLAVVLAWFGACYRALRGTHSPAA